MAPLLCLQDLGFVESIWERSLQAHSIQVESPGEFRCRLRGKLACRFTDVQLLDIHALSSVPISGVKFDPRNGGKL